MDYLLNTILTNNGLFSLKDIVLNLIINGLPSKLQNVCSFMKDDILCFKPYYKWTTF